jgi:hypothetical protein
MHELTLEILSGADAGLTDTVRARRRRRGAYVDRRA